jgi:hypothetical protein
MSGKDLNSNITLFNILGLVQLSPDKIRSKKKTGKNRITSKQWQI